MVTAVQVKQGKDMGVGTGQWTAALRKKQRQKHKRNISEMMEVVIDKDMDRTISVVMGLHAERG